MQALKIAEGVLDQYSRDQPKWWKRMDGTPILNDVAVRMAEAFRDASLGKPPVTGNGSCDVCGVGTATHRRDSYGIETWICDDCAN